jgi:hypothetical protein
MITFVGTSSLEGVSLTDIVWNIIVLKIFENSGSTKSVTFAQHNTSSYPLQGNICTSRGVNQKHKRIFFANKGENMQVF